MRYQLFTLTLVLSLGLLAACSPANKVTVRAQSMQFQEVEVAVEAGQPIVLQLINKDGYTHAFDLDELDLHAPLSANGKAELTFTANEPGRYIFYCGLPGHREAGMTGTLIVTQ